MPIDQVVDGIIDVIKKNLIARTNVSSDVTTGDVIINVENSFQFYPEQEVVLIDWGYNNPSSSHYHQYEYARVKEVNNTGSMTLYSPVIDNWTISDNTSVQKTIGHSPLYDDRVYFGDRAVIPTEEIAVTVEPLVVTNDWKYVQGGLTEEYKIKIRIYSKNIETDIGYRIVNKYSDAIYRLLNDNIHMDINDYDAPIMGDISAGSTTVVIPDTTENREQFIPSSFLPDDLSYGIQDNVGVERDISVDGVAYGGGFITITLSSPLSNSYSLSEYPVFIHYGRYLYDSRVDTVRYGDIQKKSGVMRVDELAWYGHEINQLRFCQPSRGVDHHDEWLQSSSSSSSSSSL